MRFSCLVMSIVVLLSLYVWAAPNLDGTWVKACEIQNGDFVSSRLVVSKSTSSLPQWNYTHWGHEDENCTIKYLQFDLSTTASLSDRNLDLKIVDATYTPMTDEVAEALNESEFCEISSWKKNKRTSILGKNCGDVANYFKNQMTYSIYKAEKAQLWVGEGSTDHEGSGPDRRHVNLETNAYKKGK